MRTAIFAASLLLMSATPAFAQPVPPAPGGAAAPSTAPAPAPAPSTAPAPAPAPSSPAAPEAAAAPQEAGAPPAAPGAAPQTYGAAPPTYYAAPPGYPPPPGYYGPPPPGYPPGYGPPPGWGPPPPPAEDPTARRHDGFYLRFGLGVGYGHVTRSATVSTSTADIDLTATYTGAGPAYELLLGGTVGHGIVIGGGFVGQDISRPTVKFTPPSDMLPANSFTVDGALGLVNVGPFIDWFPDDRGGLHFGGMIAIGAIGLRNDNGNSSTGVGGSLWGGYDLWVSSQWSLGAEARAVLVSAKADSSTVSGSQFDDAAQSYELMFTALYH